MAAESASGIPLELIGLLTPLPADGGPVPGEIVEHQAHAIGHAAVLLADRGVLLAGDMLSDVLIPLLDPRRPDQVGAYETALDRLGEAASHIEVLVPGHGAVAEGPEVAARLAADHAYIDALRRGEEPVDARLESRLALRPPPVEPGAGPTLIRMNCGIAAVSGLAALSLHQAQSGTASWLVTSHTCDCAARLRSRPRSVGSGRLRRGRRPCPHRPGGHRRRRGP